MPFDSLTAPMDGAHHREVGRRAARCCSRRRLPGEADDLPAEVPLVEGHEAGHWHRAFPDALGDDRI